MNKNYYEILQVNQNASNEIIEKAYKTLAKKYHPDLYKQENKKEAEEIFKKINEAYETLSNSTKRQLYDENLNSTTISKEKYEQMCLQNKMLKEQLQNLTLEYNKIISQINMSIANNNSFFSKLNHIYKNNTYYDDNNSSNIQPDNNKLLYFLRYKLNPTTKSLLSFSIILIVLIILWQIPIVQNFIISLYNNTPFADFINNVRKLDVSESKAFDVHMCKIASQLLCVSM